jgi:hypothetical protein
MEASQVFYANGAEKGKETLAYILCRSGKAAQLFFAEYTVTA